MNICLAAYAPNSCFFFHSIAASTKPTHCCFAVNGWANCSAINNQIMARASLLDNLALPKL